MHQVKSSPCKKYRKIKRDNNEFIKESYRGLIKSDLTWKGEVNGWRIIVKIKDINRNGEEYGKIVA